MNLGITGIAHVSFSNQTIVAAIGNTAQLFTIPEEINPKFTAIDESLSGKVSIDGNQITITGTTLFSIEFEPRTGVMNILSAGPAELVKLAANAKTDSKAQIAIDHINAVLNALPENGHVDRLLTFVSSTKWLDLFAELINSIRKAYPQEWAKIESELPKEFSNWLASKLKI